MVPAHINMNAFYEAVTACTIALRTSKDSAGLYMPVRPRAYDMAVAVRDALAKAANCDIVVDGWDELTKPQVHKEGSLAGIFASLT